MGTPPPRRPDVGLSDDLDLPTHESPTRGIMRKWEGARDAEGLAMEGWFKDGVARLKVAGIGARDISRDAMEPLFKALHGELPLEQLPQRLRPIYDDVRQLVLQEEADMLAFLRQVEDSGASTLMAFDAKNFAARMMAHPDYFPRGWQQKPQHLTAGRGRLGATPGLAKPRVDATFTQLLDSGLEPASWNPYAMMAQRRIAGIEYRESVTLVNRLKQRGLAQFAGEVKEESWRVPRVGPVFEGRPVPTPSVPGGTTFTQSIAVPNQVADFLENAFGRLPHVPGLRTIGQWSERAKRLKLVASLFQHVDIGARTLGPTFAPSSILRGVPLKAPSLALRLLKAQWFPSSRAQIRQWFNSTKPIYKDFAITPKMLVQEGLGIQGDISIFTRNAFTDLTEGIGRQGLPFTAARRLRDFQRFWESGLFDGVYREAQRFSLENFIIPSIRRANPAWTARQVAAESATQANIMFSTLGRWQTIFKNPTIREMSRALIFSTNESESLIRQAIGTISGPNKRLWQEFYVGIFIGLAAIANVINLAATGSPLPKEAYVPFRLNDPYAPYKVGYNTRFLSPQVPGLRGRNGAPTYIDIVGQMDTAIRWALNPVGALSARVNVVPRAVANQVKGETFFGEKLDSPAKRAVQGAVDVAAPISATTALGAVREAVPGIGNVVAEGEGRLGVSGQLSQAAGINLRAESTVGVLDASAQQQFGVPYAGLEPFERDQVRRSPQLRDELGKRQETSVERGNENSAYYAALDAADARWDELVNNIIPQLRARRITQRDAVNTYFNANTVLAAEKAQAGRDFNREFDDIEASDPSRQALAEYFQAQAAATSGGIFSPVEFQRNLVVLERRWSREQREYVLRNTNRRQIPNQLLSLLPVKTQRDYLASQRERARFSQRPRAAA